MHCHLTDPRLLGQVDEVIDRARVAGVMRMTTIGTNLEDDRAAIAFAGAGEPRCVVGIHPNYSQDATLADVPALRDLQRERAVVAMGEMGLDYFHKFADRGHQAADVRAADRAGGGSGAAGGDSLARGDR